MPLKRRLLRPHPLSRLACWLALAVGLPQLSAPLLLLSAALLVLAALRRLNEILPALRRTRWLFISIIAIYTFTKPAINAYSFGASWAGFLHGLEQVAQLAILIGALVWLFPKSARDELLYAIYLLLQPFRLVGVDAERVAVRLGLTMQLALDGPRGSLTELLIPSRQSTIPSLIVLPRPPFKIADTFILAALAAITAVALW